MPQVYEYFLYCDTLNFIRELCKVFRDLQITGIVGVTVLCYTVPRVFMLVKLACGHSLRDKKVFLSCLWHPFPYKKCACVTEQKSLCFHKAITSKHCCCAENFNRSCICTIFWNAYLCLTEYLLMLLDFITSYSQGVLRMQHIHALLHRRGRWVRISSATREHWNYTLQPAGPDCRAGAARRCMPLAPAFPLSWRRQEGA